MAAKNMELAKPPADPLPEVPFTSAVVSFGMVDKDGEESDLVYSIGGKGTRIVECKHHIKEEMARRVEDGSIVYDKTGKCVLKVEITYLRE